MQGANKTTKSSTVTGPSSFHYAAVNLTKEDGSNNAYRKGQSNA